MLDVLEKHLNGGDASVCIVARWIDGLKEEEKQAFLRIKENSQTIHVASLFADLNKSTSLPFKSILAAPAIRHSAYRLPRHHFLTAARSSFLLIPSVSDCSNKSL
mgnify:CR=1 FL=1